jgi:hypothetical protein
MEALGRQHRVFICVLQVLTRLTSSLHRSPRTGAGQALAFLNAHQDSIVLLLRETYQSPSLVGIEEAQLIIAFLAMIVQQVGRDEGRYISASDPFHPTVLSLSARFFDLHWAEDLNVDDKSKCEAREPVNLADCSGKGCIRLESSDLVVPLCVQCRAQSRRRRSRPHQRDLTARRCEKHA